MHIRCKVVSLRIRRPYREFLTNRLINSVIPCRLIIVFSVVPLLRICFFSEHRFLLSWGLKFIVISNRRIVVSWGLYGRGVLPIQIVRIVQF